jgi:multimeric flavodoxin WrbA
VADKPSTPAIPIQVRKGQAPANLSRAEFGVRFRSTFTDPAFRAEDDAIARLEAIAWDAYQDGRKSPLTRKAGPGYADADFDLAVEWIETRERIERAQQVWADPRTRTRALVICGSPRNDGTCPGEMSKTFRLAGFVQEELINARIEVDFLDLSLLTSEYGRNIHPCKGCVSTAQPLCHWPCSCYPNYSLNQPNDWMNEISVRWVSAHAIVIVTPTHWYHTSSALKLMIDRLVCADGGNPDLTTTHGKDPAKAKALELKGWSYPKHLDKRVYGLVFTAMWQASKVRGGHCPIGSTGWAWSMPAIRRGSIVTSAITGHTRRVTTRSTRTRRCRRRRATSDAPLSCSRKHCETMSCRSSSPSFRGQGRSSQWPANQTQRAIRAKSMMAVISRRPRPGQRSASTAAAGTGSTSATLR